jgi:hypothetical protein
MRIADEANREANGRILTSLHVGLGCLEYIS